MDYEADHYIISKFEYRNTYVVNLTFKYLFIELKFKKVLNEKNYFK